MYVQGVTSILLLEKGAYKCLEVTCVHFHLKITDMKQYSTHILKSDTSSGDMNEKVDHWLDSFKSSTRSILLCPQNC